MLQNKEKSYGKQCILFLCKRRDGHLYKDSVILEVENELLPYYFLFIFV